MLDLIMEFENGTLAFDGVLDLFARLIRNGQAWTLQGSYGRTAVDLINSGLITTEGEITDLGRDAIEDYFLMLDDES